MSDKMKLNIKEKKENSLAGRTEVSGVMSFEGATPANDVLRDTLAAELNADKNLVVVKHIYSKYSHHEAEFFAFAYQNQEMKNKYEVLTKHLKKKMEEEKKKLEEEKKKVAEAKKKAEEEAAAAKEKSAAEETKEGE